MSSQRRDKIANEYEVIAFDTSTSFYTEDIPLIGIKGVCDYADGHNNRKWIPFATATAASVTKALLEQYTPGGGSQTSWPGVGDIDRDLPEQTRKFLDILRSGSDPRKDKRDIGDVPGGLLRDTYLWVFENTDFRRWFDGRKGPLLWVVGDPGKGKSLLLCGIINEIESAKDAKPVSYFFCRLNDPGRCRALEILRGLIYMLLPPDSSLLSQAAKIYDRSVNAWIGFSEILRHILSDWSLPDPVLIIDALDECIDGRSNLLNLILDLMSTYPHVKWIISSRNGQDIESILHSAKRTIKLSLERNENSISEAVEIYTNHRIRQLGMMSKYDEEALDAVRHELSSEGESSFLWVAFICDEIAKLQPSDVVEWIREPSPDLYAAYARTIDGLREEADAMRILATVSVANRPLKLEELVLLTKPEGRPWGKSSLSELIALCGYLLTVRDGTIYFVHRSAELYLTREFDHGISDLHFTIASLSLQAMGQTLQRNIYRLNSPGFPVEKVVPPSPDNLTAVHYSCDYWIDHMVQTNWSQPLGALLRVDRFLRYHYLNWLEAMSLLGLLPRAIASISKLSDSLPVSLHS